MEMKHRCAFFWRSLGLLAAAPMKIQPVPAVSLKDWRSLRAIRNERVETCLLHRPTKYIGALLPTWRNWQTRQTQNLVLVRVCGFDPLRRHHLNQRLQLFYGSEVACFPTRIRPAAAFTDEEKSHSNVHKPLSAAWELEIFE